MDGRTNRREDRREYEEEGAAMTEQALNQLARQVMLDAARLEYGGLAEERPEHTFSPAFEGRMKRLLRRGNHPLRYQILHAAACLLLVLILSGCTVLAVSTEAREAFAGWVREVYETAFVYRYTGPEQTKSMEAAKPNVIYRPSWVPEGYYETSGHGMEAEQGIVCYENRKGGRLTIFYAHDFDGNALPLDGDEADVFRVFVGEAPADLYVDRTPGNANNLIWEDGGVFFRISGSPSGEELTQVAESLEAYEELPPLEERRLSWVPAGYQESSRVMMRNQGHVQYQNEEGNLITLGYRRGEEAISLQIVPSSGGELKPQTALVHGHPADFYLDEGEASALVWAEDGLLFSILAYGSREELVAMAESQEVILPDRRPAWAPEGYALYERSFLNSAVCAVTMYENPEGETILFRCQPNGDTGRLCLIPNEGSVEKRVFVDGYPADLYSAAEPGSRSEMCWSDGEALYFLSGNISDEEMLNMAESVRDMPPLPATHIPVWIPLGYRNTSAHGGVWSVEAKYENEAGERFSFRFARRGPVKDSLEECLEDIRKAVGSLEGQEVSVDGCPGRLYADAGGMNHLVWGPEGTEEVYWLSGPLSGEVLLEIAGRVNRTAG